MIMESISWWAHMCGYECNININLDASVGLRYTNTSLVISIAKMKANRLKPQ